MGISADEEPRVIFNFKSNLKEFRVVRLRNEENNKNKYAETKRRYQIQSKNINSLGESFWLDQDQVMQGDLNTYAKTNDTYALVILLINMLEDAIGPIRANADLENLIAKMDS